MRRARVEVPKELLTIKDYARTSGMSESAIRGRIQSGDWMESAQFFRRGRRIMVDPEAIARWWAKQT